jgi:hypothetical protein
MVPSYRTQAIVEYEKPPVNVFAYYIAKNDGYAMCCPICGKRYTYWYGDTNGGQDCYPTKRVIVNGSGVNDVHYQVSTSISNVVNVMLSV